MSQCHVLDNSSLHFVPQSISRTKFTMILMVQENCSSRKSYETKVGPRLYITCTYKVHLIKSAASRRVSYLYNFVLGLSVCVCLLGSLLSWL